MSHIRLHKIEVSQNSLSYHYDVSDDLAKYFRESPYTLNYELNGQPLDISRVPEGVLAVPFICNVIPIVWLCDAVLYVNEIDSEFLESIPEFKNGYIDMYPDAKFAGRVEAQKVSVNLPEGSRKSALFYSAGVDSSCTLARHYEEHPYLISIWGSDIPSDEAKGWEVLHGSIARDMETLGLENIVIRSTFRKVIDDGKLTSGFSPVLHDSWWHGIQHGISIISHAAPCDFVLGVSKQYIAATHSPEYSALSCASDPTIDNYVRFSGCRVYHDACISRQAKLKEIIDFCESRRLHIHLHVCCTSIDGTNCQNCEKCCRTIMGFLVEGADPNDYGFSVNDRILSRCRWICIHKVMYGNNEAMFWKGIQDKFTANKDRLAKSKNYKYISWLEGFDFINCNNTLLRKCIRLKKRIFSGIARRLKKLKGKAPS